MATHRLIIWHEDRMLGHFESSTPDSCDSIDHIATRFPAEAGYTLESQVAHGERRILESAPGSMRVISAEPLFEKFENGALERNES